MTEFAVGAAALCLLMLGSVTLAGYQQVQRRTAVAARQVAFVSAWSQAQSSLSKLQSVAESQVHEPGLVEAPGGQPYVGQSGVRISATQRRAPGLAGAATQVMLDPLKAAGGFLGGNFDLSAERYSVGELTVEVDPQPDLPPPFRNLSLQFRQPFALQSDAWNAAGAAHVRTRAGGLVPSSALADLQSIWRPFLAPLALIEPSLGELCLGLIEPDRIPEDRLGAGRTLQSRNCP